MNACTTCQTPKSSAEAPCPRCMLALGLLASEEPVQPPRRGLLMPALVLMTALNTAAITGLVGAMALSAAVPAGPEMSVENARSTVAAAPSQPSPSRSEPAPQRRSRPADPCADLDGLTVVAQLGALPGSARTCLETLRASSEPSARAASALLIQDAWSSGRKSTWRRLVHHHLTQLDRGDADLAYHYALDLERRGRHADALAWTDRALEHRSDWTGERYTRRVYGLYKLRAQASEGLYEAAVDTHAAGPSDQTARVMFDTHAKTRAYTLEWLAFARQSGQDTTPASNLCAQLSGDVRACAT